MDSSRIKAVESVWVKDKEAREPADKKSSVRYDSPSQYSINPAGADIPSLPYGKARSQAYDGTDRRRGSFSSFQVHPSSGRWRVLFTLREQRTSRFLSLSSQ